MEFKERLEKALAYLTETDLLSLAPGRHDVNEDMYILRISGETKSGDVVKFETHEKYVDIQWILEGEEAIEVAAMGTMEVTEPYDSAKDCQFYKTPEGPVNRVIVKAGSYMTLYPDLIHRASIAVGAPAHVEKVVAKVRM